MSFLIMKTFREMDLGDITEYEILEYGEDLPNGIRYLKYKGSYRGFTIDCQLCEQYDIDLFLETFYNFIVDIRDNLSFMINVLD